MVSNPNHYNYQHKVATLEFVLARVVALKLTHFPCFLHHYKYKATVYGNTPRLMLAQGTLCHPSPSTR